MSADVAWSRLGKGSIGALLLVGISCQRPAATPADTAGVRLLQTEITLDYRPDLGKFAGKLQLYNGSRAPVSIDNVRTDCGCLVSDWPVAPVEASDTLVLPVTLRCRGTG